MEPTQLVLYYSSINSKIWKFSEIMAGHLHHQYLKLQCFVTGVGPAGRLHVAGRAGPRQPAAQRDRQPYRPHLLRQPHRAGQPAQTD